MGTFGVHALGVGGNDVCRNVANDREHAVVVVYGVVVINGCIIVSFTIGKIAFAQFHDTFHQIVFQMELQFRLI